MLATTKPTLPEGCSCYPHNLSFLSHTHHCSVRDGPSSTPNISFVPVSVTCEPFQIRMQIFKMSLNCGSRRFSKNIFKYCKIITLGNKFPFLSCSSDSLSTNEYKEWISKEFIYLRFKGGSTFGFGYNFNFLSWIFYLNPVLITESQR